MNFESSLSVELKSIEKFINSPVNPDLVHKVIIKTLQIIPCEPGNFETGQLPSLQKFLNRLIHCLHLNNGILMSTIIYLNRLQAKLPQNCKGLPSTRHRILLSCLILSIKFNNDFSIKNYDWLSLTNNLFNLKDINLMERQLLYLLNWNLFINEYETFNNFPRFLNPIRQSLVNNIKMNQYLSEQKRFHHKVQKQQQYYSDSMSTASSSPISMQDSPSSHCRQGSNSSNESVEDISQISPMIELTASKEQQELNRLIESLSTKPLYD